MSDKNGGGDGQQQRLAADWTRPAGPANVWRVIEAEERLKDASVPVRLSIQEVPDDRHEEAVRHMCQYFIVDEVTCRSLKIAQDTDAVNDFHELWHYLLKKGISVGAYKLGSNNELLELVAVNILFIVTEEIENALGHFTVTFKSSNARKLFKFMHDVSEKVDVLGIYGVDKYISALGLSVAPTFRGQKLGVRLLEARTDIGRKYGITATATIFTGPSSQIQAERAGFETALVLPFAEIFDEDGKPLFPGVQSRELKIMLKELK